MRNVPSRTMVPASTLSPRFFSTATDSPVIILSSTAETLSPTTCPSTGIFSPACTSMVSPFCKAEIGASTGVPSTMRRAVLGVSPIKARIADAVPCLARSSSKRPVSTKVMIITEASNHVCHSIPLVPQYDSPKKVLNVLKRNEMPVDSATSVSILADKCISWRKALT